MKPKEIRNLSQEEIGARLRELRDQLVSLRVRRHTGQVEHTHELVSLRRDIARLETIRKQKSQAPAPAN